ncbi:MAG: glycine--tRNA ligase, partial [Patescibacteria group bacterium]
MDSLDKIVSLAKRRGFVFPGSEIYGGLAGFYDFGPLGAEMRHNIKEAWWRAVVLEREDVVGLDAAIIMHPQVWRSSGHTDNFSDPMVDCRKCRKRF